MAKSDKKSAAVVIPVYKNDKLNYFKKSVESILEQTFKDYEFIIAIDGPVSNNIFDYIEDLRKSGIIVLKHDKNSGLAAILNKSIEYCLQRGFKYIIRMDADDLSHPSRFLIQLDYLDKNPDVFALGTQAHIIDADDRVYGKKDSSTIINYNILKKKCDIIHASVVFRSNFFKIVGYYNEDVPLSEDYDLWFRAVKKNLKIVCLRDRLYYFRFDSNNILRRKKAQGQIIKVKMKYLKKIDYVFLIPQILIKILPKIILKFFINRSIDFK